MSNVPNTHIIEARKIKAGDRMYDARLAQGMRVQRVLVCGDGSLRIVTDVCEQRMTGSITVRVLH